MATNEHDIQQLFCKHLHLTLGPYFFSHHVYQMLCWFLRVCDTFLICSSDFSEFFGIFAEIFISLNLLIKQCKFFRGVHSVVI